MCQPTRAQWMLGTVLGALLVLLYIFSHSKPVRQALVCRRKAEMSPLATQ